MYRRTIGACALTLVLMGSSYAAPHQTRPSYDQVGELTRYPEKEITVLLYGSARNDLLPFIDRNLTQLMQLGSNERINFLVHLDTFGPGRKKLTQRFIITKNKMVKVGNDMFMDSGDPKTLLSACTWGFGNFPAKKVILILWNHGSGAREPQRGKAINPSELFIYNPETRLIELDRTIGFLDYLNESYQSPSQTLRGICFDEATGNFLTNQQVGATLRTVCDTVLGGRPIDMICCDACLMQGIEFAYSMKPYNQPGVARYLVGSEEVVLATGYSYNHMFAPLVQASMSFDEFAKHIVKTFAHTYSRITNDYTQSALDLALIDPLYESVDTVARMLIEGFKRQAHNSVHRLIQKSSSRDQCTCFEETTYKDMFNFFSNMLTHLDKVQLSDPTETDIFKQQLTQELGRALHLLKTTIIAHVHGSNLKGAFGLSMYIPEKNIDFSYALTDFGKNTAWFEMIKWYIHTKEQPA